MTLRRTATAAATLLALVCLGVAGCGKRTPDEFWSIAIKEASTNCISTDSASKSSHPGGTNRVLASKASPHRQKKTHAPNPGPSTGSQQTLDGLTTDFLFGHTVAGVGDVDGDGYDDILVGAFAGGTNSSGEVYLYRGSPNGIIPKPWWTFPCPIPGAEFGHQVEGLGDVNGDGYADFVVGATYYTAPGKPARTGGAYVFLGGPNGPRLAPGWPISGDVSDGKTGLYGGRRRRC